ncbi:hypothetical protein ACOSP7_020043 [Xanthoceras sorbifolium]
MDRKVSTDIVDLKKGEYVRIIDAEAPSLACTSFSLSYGVSSCCNLLGFVCPLMWYYATILYFGNYYHKDPRERSGLAASAIAALICTIVGVIMLGMFLL